MKKCVNCGYERQAKDDEYGFIPSTECPKCRAIYDKVRIIVPVKKEQEDLGSQLVAIKEEQKDTKKIRKTVKVHYVVSLLILTVVIIIALSFLIKSNNRISDKQAMPFLAGNADNKEKQVSPGLADRSDSKERQAPPVSTDYPVYQSVQALVKKLNPSIVLIETDVGGGSGFFIKGGNVITNHHVLSGASFAKIKTVDGHVYSVIEILAEDVEGDLVIFSANVPASEIQPLAINPILPEQGENIVVIGNPLGFLEHSVSTGIVSGIRDKEGVKFIQITAPISPGNSGGPVLNMSGEVIGVATAQLVDKRIQNINFAVSGERLATLRPGHGYPLSQLSRRSSSRASASEEERRKKIYTRAIEYHQDALIEFRSGQYGKAVDSASNALDHYKEIRSLVGMQRCFVIMALSLERLGRYDVAQYYHQQAARLAGAIPDR